MLYEFMQPGKEDWFNIRLGRLTASKADAILGSPTAYMRYMAEIALEIMVGEARTFTAPSLEHGKHFEPIACREYSFITGRKVDTPAFWVPDDQPRCGYSPDGCTEPLEATDIVAYADFRWKRPIEIKCPVDPVIHINAITDGIPKKNIPQVQFALWSTKRDVLDFISYHAAFPPKSQFHLFEVEADPKIHARLDERVPELIREVDDLVARLIDDNF